MGNDKRRAAEALCQLEGIEAEIVTGMHILGEPPEVVAQVCGIPKEEAQQISLEALKKVHNIFSNSLHPVYAPEEMAAELAEWRREQDSLPIATESTG